MQWEGQGSYDMTYSTGNTKTAPCDTTADSDQHSAHSSSLTVVLCSRPMAVRHQQERVSKMSFTLHEYCHMYLILGACGNRAYAAARAYAERYPVRRHPDSNVFHWLDERMRETVNVLPTPPLDRGRSHTRRTPALKEMVLDMVAQNSCHSTWRIAQELDVKHCAVHLIFQDEDLYPYHYSWVQGLMPHDYHHDRQYCEWLLQEHECDLGFLEHIL
jgi:hypothetical protein